MKRLMGHISRNYPAKSTNLYEDDGDDKRIAEFNKRTAELRGLVRDLTTALENRNYALAESVKLQSHYAQLLNMHDGGKRLTFDSPDAWIKRVDALRQSGE